MQADDRRLAELHYKASLTLQYLEQPEEGLKEIQVSCLVVGDAKQIMHLHRCIADLLPRFAVRTSASCICSV